MTQLRNVTQVSIVPIIILVIVPLTVHFLYSALGFNPTDDGFTLAYSRRIIEDQIPHIDFIIIRPFLSPMLHIPFVVLGGDYTYLLSRLFVWFQFSCIAYFSTLLIEKGLGKNFFGNLEKLFITLISFAISAHSYPIMAWHTIDGLFLMSMGLLLCTADRHTKKIVGYFLVSLAYLCKQSFVFAAPLALIIMGDWREIKYWLTILVPGILYFTVLLVTNALPEAILQLTSHRDIFTVGVRAYFNKYMVLGIIIGYFSARAVTINTQINFTFSKALLPLTLAGIPLIVLSTAFLAEKYIFSASFGLFGLVVGILSYHLIEKDGPQSEQVRIGFFVLITAWSASLSIGYNTPLLASGQLSAWLLVYLYHIVHNNLEIHNTRRIFIIGLSVLLVLILLSFGILRERVIFRDQVASNLTKRLDDVLPGGKGIRTNNNTYNFLIDLREAIKAVENLGLTYTIIPDCAGWWVASPQANPLSIDWTQATELNSEKLFLRVINDLESMRNNNVVIVQKVEANALSDGFIHLSNKYAVVEYVQQHFSKIYETPFFELYR